jgi:hypothetical protein
MTWCMGDKCTDDEVWERGLLLLVQVRGGEQGEMGLGRWFAEMQRWLQVLDPRLSCRYILRLVE